MSSVVVNFHGKQELAATVGAMVAEKGAAYLSFQRGSHQEVTFYSVTKADVPVLLDAAKQLLDYFAKELPPGATPVEG